MTVIYPLIKGNVHLLQITIRMNIIDKLQWRYATKKFDTTKKLSLQKISTIKEAFNLTATSYGLQPVTLVVVENQDLKNKLVEHSWGQQQVSQASHVLVLCVQKTFTTSDIEAYFKRVKDIRNTPDEILNPFKKHLEDSLGSMKETEVLEWNKKQAYIALGNLLTVCAIEEIDSCPMEGFIPEKYDKVLGLDSKNLTSVLVLPVGQRADDDYMSSLEKVRKNVEESVLEIS